MSVLLTRREFVIGSSAVMLGALPVAAAETPSFSFALVTDTHLGKPGADYVKRMATTVSEVNDAGVEFTVFCGDLVDRGEVEANQKRYPQWLDLAKGLKKDFNAVPGNHDPVAMFTKQIRPRTESVIEFKDIRVLAFADAEPNPGHLGVVTEDQLKWLQARLDEAKKKSQRVILAAHVIHHANQHPDVGWYIKEKSIREAFGRVLAANKQIVAFFAGHAHCGMRGWNDTAHGIHEVILPCVSYNLDRKLDKAPGFAVSEFRPAWTRVDVYPTRLVLNIKPVGAEVTANKELPLTPS